MSFDEIVQRYQLRVEILPSGSERIRHDYGTGIVADFLRQHGFSYKTNQGFFRSPPQEPASAHPEHNPSQFIESKCPQCSQKLRFPAGKVLKITCPKCHYEFYSGY
jgi:hypothetical protein